jgi:N6-L-threonylcarbamoyladenine synthase
MIILAIETSCDETSVAVVEDGRKLHSLVVNSQIDIHKAFGGVVPEIAARSHIEVMLPVVTQALEEAFDENGKSQMANHKQIPDSNDPNSKQDTATCHPELDSGSNQSSDWILSRAENDKSATDIRHQTSDLWNRIDAIAVTEGPGLLGSLLIGVVTARTLAWSLNKPLYPVHHILGHVYANWMIQLANPKHQAPNFKQITNSNTQNTKLSTNHYSLPTKTPEFPILALIVSGGHTQIMYATDHTNWKVIGRTQDDAVGEAFDKAAKVLGLPYPGGPSIAKIAENGDPNKYKLTTPVVNTIDPGLRDLRAEILELRNADPSFLHSIVAEHKLQQESSKKSDIASGDAKSNWIPDQAGDDKTERSESLQSSISSPQSPSQNPQSSVHSLPSTKSYNFSFSGLKTGLLRAVQKECGKSHDFPSFELAVLLNDTQKADFAASFQQTAINYLVSKTKLAYEEFSPKTVIIGGGVAASLPLRSALTEAIPLDIEYAPQVLCTDNAAMIGARAYYQSLTEDPIDPAHLDPRPTWPL